MNGIDTYVLHALYTMRDPAGVQIFIWITELGSMLVIGGISLALALYFLLHGRFSFLAGLIISIGGSSAAVFSLKEIVARSRPDALYQAYIETGFSFPSGHAALAAALYGFLAYLAWRQLSAYKLAGTTIAILNTLIFAICLSRLYLGLHYLSDVIAGYLLGTAFLAAGIFVSERLNRRSIWS